MSAQPKPFLSPEEYLELERSSEVKHEYFEGEIFAMAGGTPDHAAIAANLIAELNIQLRRSPCRVFTSDARIKVDATGLYTYPDLSVVCGALQLEDGRGDTLRNPQLIVEVLSPSSEAYDRGKKFAHYRALPSLQEYLLVSTDAPLIERFTRQADESWSLIQAKGLDAHLPLTSVPCVLSLAEVFAKVELQP